MGLGLIGIISQPLEGAKKDGVGGFFKGALKGIAGLVTKPVTGVIDMATKTVEGIKNTANIFDKDHEWMRRERFIRVFYGRQQLVKHYNTVDAEIYEFLWLSKKGKLKGIHLVSTVLLLENSPRLVVILAVEKIIMFNLEKKKIRWMVDTASVSALDLQGQSILIQLSSKHKKFAVPPSRPCFSSSTCDSSSPTPYPDSRALL